MFMLLFQLAIYVICSYSLYTIAKKLGEPYPWLAWIPVLNIVLMFRMAGRSLWWILGIIVPFLNIYILISVWHNGISKRTGHGGWWTAGLIFFGFILLPITAYTFQPVSSNSVPAPTPNL